jgi:D-Tyr-tRNAtyr deacylase
MLTREVYIHLITIKISCVKIIDTIQSYISEGFLTVIGITRDEKPQQNEVNDKNI